jgi:hypothetical protein
MDKTARYGTLEEKVEDIERYLILQVDLIRKWVVAAVALCAICAVATLASLWIALAPAGGATEARVVAPREARAAAGPKGPEHSRIASGTNSTTRKPVALATATRDKRPPEAPVPPVARPSAERSTDGRAQQQDTRTESQERGVIQTALQATTAGGTDHAVPTLVPGLPAGPKEWAFRIGASAIAPEIVRLDPVGASDRFSSKWRRLFCWTRIETESFQDIPEDRRFVIHRWIHEGEIVRERKITIASPSYRVYSMVLNPGKLPGKWWVNVLDSEGRLIGSEGFVID